MALATNHTKADRYSWFLYINLQIRLFNNIQIYLQQIYLHVVFYIKKPN